MAAETEFAIGATASCSDGLCGEVSRMIVDPATRTVTHLVIEPKHRREPGRLVSLDLVDTTTGEIRLRCTLAEFGKLDPAEESELRGRCRQHGGRRYGCPRWAYHTPRGPMSRMWFRWVKQKLAAVSTSMLWMVRSGRWRASWSIRATTA